MSAAAMPLLLRNGAPVLLKDIPEFPFHEFRSGVLADVQGGARIAAFFGVPVESEIRLHALLADGASGSIHWRTTTVATEYPALTVDCEAFQWFERELVEQWGVRPTGHPWLKPIRFQRPFRPGGRAPGCADGADPLPGIADYFRVGGSEAHEVAVGPVHAGVIEPGHFRFQCHGELVLNLEISLGYQHRGIERALPGGPDRRTIHYMETLAGDTTIGHATAYCLSHEGLSGVRASDGAARIRAVALELERLANHTGDLGALANDVGYLPTASYCGRIRGDFLNMTALLCGNRFGRRLLRPGGIGVGVEPRTLEELRKRLDAAFADVTEAVELLGRAPSVRARFENAGRLEKDVCIELGLVGVAARACGVERDVRREFPVGAYVEQPFQVSTEETGDVHARARVRWLEIETSMEFIRRQLDRLAADGQAVPPVALPEAGVAAALAPGTAVVSLVEGWRGEICHVAATDSAGRFAFYKVVDPSFHNWFGLATALRGQQISDFPLCNKSFNLSYCGHDL